MGVSVGVTMPLPRTASIAARATDVYSEVCEKIMRSLGKGELPEDVHSLLPYLRQLLTCCACAGLIEDAMMAIPCGHCYCYPCQYKDPIMKIHCRQCRQREGLVVNDQLRMVVDLYRQLMGLVGVACKLTRVLQEMVREVTEGVKVSRDVFLVVPPLSYRSNKMSTPLKLKASQGKKHSRKSSQLRKLHDEDRGTAEGNTDEGVVDEGVANADEGVVMESSFNRDDVTNDSLLSISCSPSSLAMDDVSLLVPPDIDSLAVLSSARERLGSTGDVGDSIPVPARLDPKPEVALNPKDHGGSSDKEIDSVSIKGSGRKRKKKEKKQVVLSEHESQDDSEDGEERNFSCRCGTNPGVQHGHLICVKKKCPCYINKMPCVKCRCKGCCNPYN